MAGAALGAGISLVGGLIGTSSSNKAAADSTAAQIASSEKALEISLAAQGAAVEAQIAASYSIFYQQKAAQYDIFNKTMEANYEIYNATQAARYQTLIQQFEFQKTSDLTTARAGVSIAKVEANALKAAARAQMEKNVKAAAITAAHNLNAANIQATGIREGAALEYAHASQNIALAWEEAQENLRRTGNQQNATRALARATIGATGGVMREGTSQQIYYQDLSDEMFRQYNWMEGAYTSQRDIATQQSEENRQYAMDQAGRMIEITESENQALLESTQVENDAIWKVANIQGESTINKAQINLKAVQEIYSRNYFTPPEKLYYTPTSVPGGGGGGGGGGHGAGSGGSGGSNTKAPTGQNTVDLLRVGGGKRIELTYEQFSQNERYYLNENLFYTQGGTPSWYTNARNTDTDRSAGPNSFRSPSPYERQSQPGGIGGY